MRREAHVPRGGPDGGDGGRGGSVILVAEAGLTSLAEYRRSPHVKATSGGRGARRRAHGRDGVDVLVPVPPGTVARTHPEGELLGEVLAPGDRLVVARGGRGGRGNVHFVTSTHQAPRHYERGDPGEERWIDLELKLIAEIGLVGAPNAGKSTLLAGLTAARPEVAPYPFTTTTPNLGVIAIDAGGADERAAVIADVPGLIEGAHRGQGLGHEFLRHIDRCRVLVGVIDGAADDPAGDWEAVAAELRLHDPGLLERPLRIAVTKQDLPEAHARWRAVRARLGFLELCKNPEAAAEVTLQPVERLGVDAAILFADILLVLEPLGVGLEFTRGDGPRIERPVRSAAAARGLPAVEVEDAVGFVFETVARVRKALADRVPLIGFAGAPFTLASYLIEGGPSREFLLTKAFMRAEPDAWAAMMTSLADVTAEYLNGQIAAGVQAVQLFDSWVGALSPADYRDFVLPHSRRVIGALRPGVAVIHFGVGTGGLLPLMKAAGGDVIGLDWRVELASTWDRLGHDVAVQGNLDPAVLLADVPAIRRAAREILDAAAGRPGHVFNLGHGIHKDTPVEHVKALVDIVHELSLR